MMQAPDIGRVYFRKDTLFGGQTVVQWTLHYRDKAGSFHEVKRRQELEAGIAEIPSALRELAHEVEKALNEIR